MRGLSVIGAGNMGSALIRGLVRSEHTNAETILVFDIDSGKTKALKQELGVTAVSDIGETVRSGTDAIVLAVKPQSVGEVLDRVASHIHDRPMVISIAAGITTEFILSRLSPKARVIRAMPNAAAMLRRSATAVCKAGEADEKDLAMALDIFRAFGSAAPVDEKLINAVTGLSASGLAYLFVIMEALTDGGVLMGLDRPTARALTIQTVLGATEMAASENAAFSDLKDRITSPGGTTITGLQVIERAGLRGILMDAIAAATRRAEELQA